MSAFFLCLERDVPDNGFRCVKLFQEHLLISRFGDGFAVDSAICPHRGHLFTEKEEGDLVGLKCPYHGRKFVPGMGPIIYPISGMLFSEIVNNYEMLQEIGSDLGDEYFELTQIVEAPFYLRMQNTMDPRHLASVHGEGFAKLFASSRPYDVNFSADRTISSYRMRVTDLTRMSYRRMLLKSSVNELLAKDFLHVSVFPHLSMTSFLGVFYSIETAVPFEGGGCLVTTRFFLSKTRAVPKLLINQARDANSKILMEDRAIVESWAKTYTDHDPREFEPGEERIESYVAMLDSSVKHGSPNGPPRRGIDNRS